MPVGWLTMGTPEYLQELIKRDPDAYEAEVDRLVSGAGGVLFKIYWDQGCSQTQVIVGVPAEGADQVYEKLERIFQTSVKRLWNLQEKKRHPFEAS
jgi:hypothetical protein